MVVVVMMDIDDIDDDLLHINNAGGAFFMLWFVMQTLDDTKDSTAGPTM